MQSTGSHILKMNMEAVLKDTINLRKILRSLFVFRKFTE